MMELRTIRYFVAVADAGSVTAATRVIHVTQPSLSRQLRQLEHELGLALFTRRDGKLVLTQGGKQFLPIARDLISRADAARMAASSISLGRLRSLTLSAPAVTTTDIVAPFIATFTADDPMPLVQPPDANNEYDALDRGADLTIGTRPPPAHLAVADLARLPLFAYLPPDHPYAGRDRIELVDLVRQPLLLPTADSHSRRTLDAAVDTAKLSYRDVTDFTSSEIAQAVAAAGRGIAVVSDDARFGLVGLRVHAAAVGWVEISLYAAWQPRHHAADQIAALTSRLRDFVTARYGLTATG